MSLRTVASPCVNMLGGHVCGRAGGDVVCAVHAAGDSEIGDAHLTAAVEHDVRRFQITMKDTFIVCGGETGAELPGYLDGLVARQAPDPSEEARQIFAVDEFH